MSDESAADESSDDTSKIETSEIGVQADPLDEEENVAKTEESEDQEVNSLEENGSLNEKKRLDEKRQRGRVKGKISPSLLKKKRRSSSCASSIISHPSISPERLKELREIVEKAAQHHKTFTILGRYPSIKEALKNRGWVQNFDLQRLTLPKQRQFDDDVSVLARLQSADETERLVISRLLRHTPVSFLWATSENIDWNSLSKTTLVSRFPRVYFTTKVGICNYLQQSHWFCEAGISNTMFPRCYSISNSDDLDAFIKDFRLTACVGLLKRLISSIDESQVVFDETGKIPLKTVEFAVKRITEFVAKESHEDIDRETEEKVWDHQWDQFLTFYYQFVHHGHKFVSASDAQITEIYSCSKMTLTALDDCWPQKNMDGTNNLWIVKPGAKSRGRGIVVLNKLEDIVSRVSCFQSNEPRFVVQKYIERPLLIYNTKFDIRQWFLVTSVYPLTIWMYKESYLRFCSQLFSLNNMHESVHLSNNAIQCKYKNAHKRDRALPDENMWDCYTFKTYLRTLGLPSDRWDSVIYRGMKECITGALLAAQEHMEHRRNCFELYGADFMLTEDLVPWLIEINSSPCMSPTTSVTARMCSQCLEDVIKVVIDKRYNKDADTGMFELAYRQQVSSPQPYMGMNLTVKGNKIGRGGMRSRNGSKGSEDLSRDLGSPNVKEAISRLSDRLKEEPRLGESIENEENSGEIGERKREDVTTTSGVSSGVSDSEYNKHRVKTEVKKRSYKKHCCVKRASITQAVARYKSRNYDEIAKRLRLQSENIKCKTVQIPQTTELFDWKKRIEQTRADCRKMLQKITQIDKSDLISNINNSEKVSYRKSKSCSSKINLPDIKSSPKREINNNITTLTKINSNNCNNQLPSCA